MIGIIISVLKNYGLYLIAVYILLAVIFFKFPGILHKKKSFSGKIWDSLSESSDRKNSIEGKKLWHISHRGGSRESLENTIEAFDHSVKRAKTDMLEFDIYLTKDKKMVVFHDFDMDRVMGVNKSIEEFNYEDIPAFLEEFMLHFGINYVYRVSDGEDPNYRYVPTLREVFERYPGTPMTFEIKSYSLEII